MTIDDKIRDEKLQYNINWFHVLSLDCGFTVQCGKPRWWLLQVTSFKQENCEEKLQLIQFTDFIGSQASYRK